MRIAARVAPETSLQVHPRKASETTFRVSPPESLPLDLEVTIQIAGTFDTEISCGNTAEVAVSFAAQDPPRFALRLPLGTTS